ncbi:MAG: DUF975 family protein [Roseburia sp.]|nr:DUF975 family protein [Roseburia sp.]
MWSRIKLKEKAKIRFQANYWRAVLVALILAFLAGSAGSSRGGTPSFDSDFPSSFESSAAIMEIPELVDSFEDDLSDELYDIDLLFTAGVASMIAAIIFVVVVVIICAVVLPLRVLLLNPLEIGCNRFFTKNLNEDAQVKEICYSFDYGYKNNIKTMFFRDLYVFLWSLLFVIPGIIKSYEYRMIPFILGENPGMDTDTAFAMSRKMMDGNKWDAFVLDLSFIGWHILSACTFGILGVFYVKPYVYQTDAALYEALKMQGTSQTF